MTSDASAEFPVLVPELMPQMTEANLVRWLKAEGARVMRGEPLVEIETDKAVTEIEAPHEGYLRQILVPDGTASVPTHTPIGIIAAADSPTVAPISTPAVIDRVRASPVARRLAHQQGIDLRTVAGSGPQGRIVKVDVERTRIEPAPAATSPPRLGNEFDEVRAQFDRLQIPYELHANSSARRSIARRLTLAKQTIPHCYLTIECCVDKATALRADLNAGAVPTRLSMNDFTLLATARALRRTPALNATWSEESILRFTRIDLSFAVATPAGLLTPILTDAGSLGLLELAAAARELAVRAKGGKLQPQEYQGGTFCVSNLGMRGIQSFSAILNPPQAGILAVGAIEPRAVVRNGALTIATMMTCTLTFDHRVVDGAEAAEFLTSFKALIEAPVGLLLPDR